MARTINSAGLMLIKEAEGLRLKPYQDSAGVWTIGYGSTRGITAETHPITEEAAEELLRNDLEHAQAEVERLIHVHLSENQYAALVSLVFNAGSAPLLKTLGKLLNAGSYDTAAHEFGRWNHADGVVVKGLTTRREKERALFLTE